MNLPSRSNHPNPRLVDTEKLKARELWHKLAVKVINWKDTGTLTLIEKITIKEWSTYCSRMVEINVTKGKQNALDNLEETRKTIQSHGGFEG